MERLCRAPGIYLTGILCYCLSSAKSMSPTTPPTSDPTGRACARRSGSRAERIQRK